MKILSKTVVMLNLFQHLSCKIDLSVPLRSSRDDDDFIDVCCHSERSEESLTYETLPLISRVFKDPERSEG